MNSAWYSHYCISCYWWLYPIFLIIYIYMYTSTHIHTTIHYLCSISHKFPSYGYGSIPIHTILSGLFTSIYQLFWCSPGVPGFWHTAICLLLTVENLPWMSWSHSKAPSDGAAAATTIGPPVDRCAHFVTGGAKGSVAKGLVVLTRYRSIL